MQDLKAWNHTRQNAPSRCQEAAQSVGETAGAPQRARPGVGAHSLRVIGNFTDTHDHEASGLSAPGILVLAHEKLYLIIFPFKKAQWSSFPCGYIGAGLWSQKDLEQIKPSPPVFPSVNGLQGSGSGTRGADVCELSRCLSRGL